MDENAKGRHRAEDVLPPTFHPSPLAGDILRDPAMRKTQLEYIVGGLGEIRLAGDLLAGPIEDEGTRQALASRIGAEATRLQRLVKALAVGALAALVLTVGLVAGPSAGRAEAMEAPQPDPVAQTVRVVAQSSVSVVLNRATVTVRVRVTTAHVTPAGRWCASLWAPTSYGQGFAGRTCAATPTFTVVGTLDARYVPVGRSRIAVTDDVAPLDTVPASVTLIARRPSRFGVGTWTPTQFGDGLTVYAALSAYTPAVGRWTPQQASPVQVQELRGGRWVTVAAGTTNRNGTFLITVIVGGGPHTLRVHRDTGATVTAVNGTPRPFYLIPTDVPDGTV